MLFRPGIPNPTAFALPSCLLCYLSPCRNQVQPHHKTYRTYRENASHSYASLQYVLWWSWAESNRRPERLSLGFIQPYFSGLDLYQQYTTGCVRSHENPSSIQSLQLTVCSSTLPLKYGAPGQNRTATPGLQNRTSTTKDTRANPTVNLRSMRGPLSSRYLKSSGLD